MRTAAYLVPLLGLLWALTACSDDGQTTPPDGATTQDLQPSDGVSLADRAPQGPGTSCQAEDTTVLFETTGSRKGWQPQIAWSDNQYGVAWAQEVEENSVIKRKPVFVRVGKDGKKIGQVTDLTQSPTLYTLGPPVVAGLSKGFAVIWSDTRAGSDTEDLYMLKLDEKGQRLDGNAVCTAPGCGEIKVTSGGGSTMPYLARRAYVDIEGPTVVSDLALVWRDGRDVQSVPYPPYTTGRYDIYFKVLDPATGADKVSEKRVTTDSSEDQPGWPRIAYNQNKYAVVWQHSSGLSSHELFYAALGTDGAVTESEQSLAKASGLLSSSPDLVWADKEFGIVFTENPAANTGAVRFSRITTDGKLMAIQQVTGAGDPCTPAVAYNGRHYAVAWQDQCGKTGSKLVFATIGADGTPLQPSGKSCSGSSDPNCGLVTVSLDTDGTDAFPEMIGVNGRFAVTWMNAPKGRIYFSHVVCK